MLTKRKLHWPEYLMEFMGLGLFMISACSVAIVLFHPLSPVTKNLESSALRRVLMGIAMGSAAIGLIYSPWGKQSGAHFNPSVTFTFFRLGKVSARDALMYTVFQSLGGVVGVTTMAILVPHWISDPAVNYVPTVPGAAGIAVAWLTEFVTSLILMLVVLNVSNSSHARWTGVFAGILVALNISFAAPLSGMSMNPARTLASAIPSDTWNSIWVYFTAPPLAMLLAAQCFVWAKGPRAVFCAKLHHQNSKRCIFCDARAARAKKTADTFACNLQHVITSKNA